MKLTMLCFAMLTLAACGSGESESTCTVTPSVAATADFTLPSGALHCVAPVLQPPASSS